QQVHIHELVGEKFVLGIIEDGFELVGSGGGIDLIVDGEQLSGGNLVGVIAVVGSHHQGRALFHALHDLRQLILRQSENDGNRLELSDHYQTVGVRSMDYVADVHQAQPDAAADRRGDVQINDLQLGIVNGRHIRFDGPFVGTHKGLLGV